MTALFGAAGLLVPLLARTPLAGDARSAARAEALASRCVIHATLGRFEDALTDSTETIDLLRDLAERYPDKYRHEYAVALANGVGPLWKNGRVEDALRCADEAVRLGAELVSVRRTMFLPVLALAHTNRSAVFAQLGRHGDAVADLDVAVHAYRRLADRRPEVHPFDLAEKIGNRADQHLLAGSLNEALADAEESADIHRKLMDPDSADGLTELDNALFRLYRVYRDMRKNQEAHDVIVELVTFERDRAALAPEEAVPLLAIALWHLASALAMLDRHAESLTAAAESVELLRPLADEDPDLLEELAEALLVHGSALAALDRHREAEPVLRDCLNTFEALDRAQPNEYSDRIDAARRLHDRLRRDE